MEIINIGSVKKENIKTEEIKFLLALHSVEYLGPSALKTLFDHYGSFEKIWNASPGELRKFRVQERAIENFKTAKKDLDPEQYFETLIKNGINIVTIFDENYPELLKEIHDPPMIIYYKGNLNPEILEKCFGVVGTRMPTSYGRLVTEKLTRELSNAGLTIVSGLARGVDTIAHATTVEANGKTIAVLGGGLFKIFPAENLRLAEKIASGFGAVITEFPPNYPHLAGNFPARNRIISGLSKGVLVTEAAEDSGSLITARLALEQGRDVYAVPGPITSSMSEGTSVLLKEGAKLVSSAKDILDDMGIKPKSTADLTGVKLEKEETEILEFIKDEGKHVDEIARFLKKPVAEVSGNLLKLEIAGIVDNLGGGNYTKS